MRILCISDQVDPLVYSPRMRERFKDVDLVLSAGDLPPEYLGFITSMLNKDLVFVMGNHDLGELEARGVHRWVGSREEATDSSTARWTQVSGSRQWKGSSSLGFPARCSITTEPTNTANSRCPSG